MVCINIFLYFQKVFESFLLMNKSFITQWAYFINLRSGIKVRVFEMLYKIFTTLLNFINFFETFQNGDKNSYTCSYKSMHYILQLQF